MAAVPEHCDDDHLLELANGLLAAAERRACLDHLARCAPCEGRFRRIVGAREQALGALPVRRAGSWAPPSRPIATARVRWLAAGLTAAAMLAAVLWRASPEPARQYWMPRATERTQQRSASGIGPYSGALEAYDRRDAKETLRLLDSSGAPVQHSYMRLIRASALLNADQAREAQDTLLEISSLLPEPGRRRALWMLYLCHLRLGDADAAKVLLARLVDEPGEVGELARAER